MSKYDSLAEQVAEDFRSTMSGMSVMRKSMTTMQKAIATMQETMTIMDGDLRRLRKSVGRTYRTIQTLLEHEQETDSRLDRLESWQKQVDARLSA